jgi:transposase
MLMSEAELITKVEHDAAIAERDDRIAQLEFTIEKFKRLLLGRSSEKAAVNLETGAVQQSLFDEDDPSLPSSATRSPKKQLDAPKTRKPRFGVRLERKVVELTLDESERCCPCGETQTSIGVDKSEKLEFIPATVKVLEIHRHRYACSRCKASGVRNAPLFETAFPKAAVTDATRAHFLVQKFVDHLPYYRQAAILRRNDVELSDSTIGRYVLEAADTLAPVVIAMCDEVLSSRYIQADETTLPVLKTERSKPGAHRGYLWTYGIPWSTVVFDYRRSRSGKHPTQFLERFRGIVQSDRYGGYNPVRERDDILDVACWAHARRKFIEAETSAGRRVKPILKLIAGLYGVEKEAREDQLSSEARAALRQGRASPILKDLRRTIKDLLPSVRPKSPLGQAIEYTLTHWEALEVYVEFGQVEIDTNLLENSIRPVALGRKNYLFAGSDIGAEAAATIYSITETCRRLGLNPYRYLVELFRRLARVEILDPDLYRSLTPMRFQAELRSP